jgi:hypothetical protein
MIFFNLEKNINVRKKIRKLNSFIAFREKIKQRVIRSCK